MFPLKFLILPNKMACHIFCLRNNNTNGDDDAVGEYFGTIFLETPCLCKI